MSYLWPTADGRLRPRAGPGWGTPAAAVLFALRGPVSLEQAVLSSGAGSPGNPRMPAAPLTPGHSPAAEPPWQSVTVSGRGWVRPRRPAAGPAAADLR